MSRSIVRVLTSYRPASCRADRGRGATARSSSTSAYSRSVRFTLTHATPGHRHFGPAVDQPSPARPTAHLSCHILRPRAPLTPVTRQTGPVTTPTSRPAGPGLDLLSWLAAAHVADEVRVLR